jgi:hypothetical protein
VDRLDRFRAAPNLPLAELSCETLEHKEYRDVVIHAVDNLVKTIEAVFIVTMYMEDKKCSVVSI